MSGPEREDGTRDRHDGDVAEVRHARGIAEFLQAAEPWWPWYFTRYLVSI